jgi:hypothetical protein
MGNRAALRMLGAPEIRNALLLNEIGVLIQGLGKLSTEFVCQGDSFPHHLVLRRLTRGRDPHLGAEISAEAAVLRALEACELEAAALLAEALRRRAEESGVRAHSAVQLFPLELESILDEVGGELGPQDPSGYERVARLARAVCSDFQWQVQQEEAMEAIRPPFIAAGGLLEGLDELPSVANLVEMQGRTWHPQALLPPEVALLRSIEGSLGVPGSPASVLTEERLYYARQLFCEVLANQLLEINNIRKDGPGDLGSWFWRSRLYATSDEGLAALKSLEEGMPIDGEERDAALWLGLRAIVRWAYGKILLRDEEGRVQSSLWEQNHLLSALYKASLAQALVEGRWPQGEGPNWRLVKVGLRHPTVRALMEIKQLLEVEYPLGNEVYRGTKEMVFSFPDLDEETIEHLLAALAEEIDQLLGGAGNVDLSTERVLDVAHVSRLRSGI